jgi:glycosyltransferase involved in cell wall biosynthesis
MKIFYVITRAECGGAQVALLNLITNLPPGFEPIVAAGQEGYLQEECARRGISYRVVPGLVAPISPIKDTLALIRLIALIRRDKPCVVHAHTSKAGILGRVAAWLTRTPVIFTAHTWSFDEGVPHLRKKIAVPIERITAALGGKIITVADSNTREALRHSITARQNLVRIWNGVPDSRLRASPGSGERVTLITVARMVPQKDHALLLRSLAGVTGNWCLQMVGDGPLQEDIRLLAEKLELGGRLQFLGERKDIAELLSQADVFVLPSKWEGLPVSILEAMRAGLPVVATDVGGVRESVQEGVTGFLCKIHDEEGLRDRIQTLITLPSLMSQMGREGRRRYEEHFRIETMVDKTVELYEEIDGSSVDAVALAGRQSA